MKNQYKVVLFDSFDKLDGIGASWNELLLQSHANTIFLTWEWLYTWSENFCRGDRKPFLLAVYQKSKLIGLAPWCLRFVKTGLNTLRQIEFLGSPEMGSDYLDVIIKMGKEEVVAECVYKHLFAEACGCWDSILLQDIPSESLFLLHFLERIRRDGKYALVNEGVYCPICMLQGSWEEFLKNLSSNRRQQFRRHYRLLQRRGQVRLDTCVPSTDGGDILDRFFLLYESRWGETVDQRFYNHLNRFIDICKSLSWIQFDFLKVNGKDIAAILHYRYQNKLLMHLMAVDRDFHPNISIGNILVGLCLEKAISQGIILYDFLRGAENYKFHWANNGRRAVRLNLYVRRLNILPSVSKTMLKDIARIILR